MIVVNAGKGNSITGVSITVARGKWLGSRSQDHANNLPDLVFWPRDTGFSLTASEIFQQQPFKLYEKAKGVAAKPEDL